MQSTPSPSDRVAPTFVGQLRSGNFNTPLYRLTIHADHVAFRYRTEKVIPISAIESVCLHRLPIVGWLYPSGVRFQHRSPDFHPRLIFNTLRSGQVIEALQQMGYPVIRT